MSSQHLPWYRRLSVRLAACIAIVLLVFEQGASQLHGALGSWLGLRPDKAPYRIHLDDSDRSAKLPEPVEAAAAGWFDGASADSDAQRRALDQALAAWRDGPVVSYVVTDAALVVRATSETSSALVGQRLLPTFDESAMVEWHPVLRAGALLGWLCVSLPSPLVAAKGFTEKIPGNPLVLTDTEARAVAVREWWASQVTQWTLRLAVASMVALFVSWLVTRRIVRLADAARIDPAGDESMVGVDLHGSDEIAGLARALGAARARVRALLEELAARDTARREWIAQVSHDLRTPLTALVACLERTVPPAERLQREHGADADADAVRQGLDVALADADRVAQLARDLLDAARLDLPHRLVLELVLPGELLERVAQQLEPLAAKVGLVLHVDVAPDLPTVRGDGRLLLRALENLTRNAIEHAHTCVQLRAAPAAKGVEFSVMDDGSGLLAAAPKEGDRRRADAAGLGLQVVRRMLAAHGSELEMTDRREGGCGSRFVLAPWTE